MSEFEWFIHRMLYINPYQLIRASRKMEIKLKVKESTETDMIDVGIYVNKKQVAFFSGWNNIDKLVEKVKKILDEKIKEFYENLR